MIQICYYNGCGVVYGEKSRYPTRSITWAMPKAPQSLLKRDKG